MRRLFSAYHGTGSVYALVATLYGTNISAAYIPTHTYACSMISLVNPCVNSPLSWTIASVVTRNSGHFPLSVRALPFQNRALHTRSAIFFTTHLHIYRSRDGRHACSYSELLAPPAGGSHLRSPLGLCLEQVWEPLHVDHPLRSHSLISYLLGSLVFTLR
ncbi:hypothetical protein WDU94_010983 [Cyamophila willieti]